MLVVTGAMLFSVQRDCKALHRGGWGSWQHSDRPVYQEGKKRYFYPLNQDTTAASAELESHWW